VGPSYEKQHNMTQLLHAINKKQLSHSETYSTAISSSCLSPYLSLYNVITAHNPVTVKHDDLNATSIC